VHFVRAKPTAQPTSGGTGAPRLRLRRRVLPVAGELVDGAKPLRPHPDVVVLGTGGLTALPDHADHADLIDTACPRSGSPAPHVHPEPLGEQWVGPDLWGDPCDSSCRHMPDGPSTHLSLRL